MSKPKLGLGRGFDSLIPTQLLDDEFDPTQEQDERLSELRTLKIADVVPNPHQPRRTFDQAALEDMAESIKQHGVMLPVVVTKTGKKYELVAGERRWRASQIAGKTEIPALVRSYDDQKKLELALIENLQREDLNPLEIATAYLKLQQQFNLKLEDIAKRAGKKGISTVSNTLRLLSLPKEAKDALVANKITEGHARQILALKEPEVQQELLELIMKHEWSVRKAEQFVIGYKEGQKDRNAAVAKVKTETPATQDLSKRLGAQVSVKHMAHGGRLMIEFKNDDDLNRITGMLLG
ncbi:MAG TPA: ParB/RepB/Spo0J family partition protein [Candidatus Saccharimonadales bacterium]|nr:ParB/RepB/Spo0J family partition protein [Candidatus Saccharimonadales bacterium]